MKQEDVAAMQGIVSEAEVLHEVAAQVVEEEQVWEVPGEQMWEELGEQVVSVMVVQEDPMEPGTYVLSLPEVVHQEEVEQMQDL